MKKNIGLILVLVLVIMMVGTYIKQQTEQDEAIAENAKGYEVETGIAKEQFAPDFTLTNLAGEEVTLSDLRGKNVILNFWATWCAPCEAEMPHFQKYYDQYAGQDNVEIIGVNATYAKEKIERVKQFTKSYDLTFPILLEPTGTVAERYEVLTIPTTFFIDAEGKVQRQIKGPLDLDALQGYVAELNS
ncbi:MAG: TlpA disulfide reductase family protein [Solibacillus sp.]